MCLGFRLLLGLVFVFWDFGLRAWALKVQGFRLVFRGFDRFRFGCVTGCFGSSLLISVPRWSCHELAVTRKNMWIWQLDVFVSQLLD